VEIIFEIFGELIFQVVFSVLGEIFSGLFGAGVSNVSGWKPSAGMKGFLYILGGCGLAALSLLLFPHAYARTMDVRLAVMIGSPLACGLIMGLYHAWRDKKKHAAPFSMRGFFYGVLFSAPITVGRFLFATPP